MIRFCLECPLEEICEQRVVIANYVNQQQAEHQVATLAELELEAEQFSDPAQPFQQLIIGLRLRRRNLQLAAQYGVQTLKLTSEILVELAQQIHERNNCDGAIVTRRRGITRRPVELECGSLERRERLKDHIERRPAPDHIVISERPEQ